MIRDVQLSTGLLSLALQIKRMSTLVDPKRSQGLIPVPQQVVSAEPSRTFVALLLPNPTGDGDSSYLKYEDIESNIWEAPQCLQSNKSNLISSRHSVW